MTVAIDFDGVIHRYSKGWQDGSVYDPPMPGAIEALTEMLVHEAVCVITARDVEQVVEALEKWGLPARADDGKGNRFWNEPDILLVTNRKFAARAYLDDRAVLFDPRQGWDSALEALGFRQPSKTVEEKIRKIHHKTRSKTCGHCSENDYPDYAVPYPCETVRALGPE